MLLSGNRGTCSKYDITIAEGDFKGHLEIKWEGEPFKVGDFIHSYVLDMYTKCGMNLKHVLIACTYRVYLSTNL